MTKSIAGGSAAYPEIPQEKPDIRLLAIDLDDTLLRSDYTISPRTKRAIQRARQQGVVVTLATGRMYVSALPYAQELDIDVPLITYQGALVIMTDGRIISHHPMDYQLSMELLDFLLPFGYHVNVYIGDQLFIEESSPEAARYGARTRTYLYQVPSLREMMKQRAAGATKFSLIASAEEVKEVIDATKARFGDRVLTVPSKPTFLEFGRPDMGKGVALAEMAAKLDIDSSQVMAIGDSPNDLDMLEYAGWGIAMANGECCAKERARWITAANDEEGVAIAIESLVLE
ncbi:MAG: Cof-type HAD-IIB family hydrolase [Clostridiales bacterium]